MKAEDMKGSFSADIGNISTVSDNSTLNEKLDQIIGNQNLIIEKLDSMGVSNSYEAPEVEEKLIEDDLATDSSDIEKIEDQEEKSFTSELDEVVRDLKAKKVAEPVPAEADLMTTKEFSNEVDQILAEVNKKEEPVVDENPFTKVNVDPAPVAEEPAKAEVTPIAAPVEPAKEASDFVDITTLLNESVEANPVVAETPVAPVAPVVEEPAKVEAIPAVPAEPVAPVVETAPVAPVAEVAPVQEIQTPAEVTPVVEAKKSYSDVTTDYVGMTIPGTEVKTEGQHRTLLVTNNEKFKQVKQADKTLVMSNVA